MYTNEEGIESEKVGNESLKEIKIWKNKIINKIAKLLKNNKFVMATLSAFILFSLVNAMMICTFFQIMVKLGR